MKGSLYLIDINPKVCIFKLFNFLNNTQVFLWVEWADLGVSSLWRRCQGHVGAVGLSSVKRATLLAVFEPDLSLSTLLRAMLDSEEKLNAVSSFYKSILLQKEAAKREWELDPNSLPIRIGSWKARSATQGLPGQSAAVTPDLRAIDRAMYRPHFTVLSPEKGLLCLREPLRSY